MNQDGASNSNSQTGGVTKKISKKSSNYKGSTSQMKEETTETTLSMKKKPKIGKFSYMIKS